MKINTALAVALNLALDLALSGCSTVPRTPPVAPVSVATIRAEIVKAQSYNGRLDAKATVVERWLMERAGK